MASDSDAERARAGAAATVATTPPSTSSVASRAAFRAMTILLHRFDGQPAGRLRSRMEYVEAETLDATADWHRSRPAGTTPP